MLAVICLQACGEPPGADQAAECSPVLARVGDLRLCAADVELLAGQAAELRRELGMEVGEAGRLELAVEFLALLQLDEVAEARERLLVRTYLDRMFQQEEARPVTDAELEQAHRDEIKSFLTSGTSEIYRPTLIDAAAIIVGCFPDQHPPDDDEEPVLTMQQVRELAKKITAACGEQVADLDDFLSIARRFMRKNPTVEVTEYSRVFKDPRLARWPAPPVHRTITGLDGNGAISASLEGRGVVYIIRRGITYPGKGEDPAEIREELSGRVRFTRKENAYRERVNQLRERYRVRTWPERLSGP